MLRLRNNCKFILMPSPFVKFYPCVNRKANTTKISPRDEKGLFLPRDEKRILCRLIKFIPTEIFAISIDINFN